MEHEKTDAIVLRVVEFSETSCVVTLFSRKLGKISAIAKGARRKKNPYEGAIDLIAICRIVFLHKSSQSLDILTEAKLQRRFRSASTDLDRFYAGLYLVELLNLLTDEADPHELLFDAACLAIERIDSQSSLKDALIEFEIRMLDLLGHLPMLTQCVSCGRTRKTMNRVHFGLNEGGVICPDCRAGKQNIISLSSDGLELLLTLTDHTKIKSMKTTQYSSNHSAYPEVRRLVSKYILHLIGYPPRLQKYLGNL
jgi:DNA repair protein RecO (recombination protein O)